MKYFYYGVVTITLFFILLAIADCERGKKKIPEFILIVKPNVKSRERRNSESCCFVSNCNEIPLNTENHNLFQCYRTTVCGDICKKVNQKQKSGFHSTPGYRKRLYYMKKICIFRECVDNRIDCSVCPNPEKGDFSTYNLSDLCSGCYY